MGLGDAIEIICKELDNTESNLNNAINRAKDACRYTAGEKSLERDLKRSILSLGKLMPTLKSVRSVIEAYFD